MQMCSSLQKKNQIDKKFNCVWNEQRLYFGLQIIY